MGEFALQTLRYLSVAFGENDFYVSRSKDQASTQYDLASVFILFSVT